MKDLNVLQGTEAWLSIRSSYPRTGSIAPSAMGVGKNITRNELLSMKATGTEQEFSDFVQRRVLDKGHEYEAMARPIAERLVGEELYPATVTSDDDYLLASLDGMTMLGNIIWEHKQPNAELVAEVEAGRCPDYHYWQVVQGLAVTGADKCLFMVSDGTEENCVWCWVDRNEDDCARLIAGWKQFDADLSAYVPQEVIPAAVAAPVKDLPAVIYKMNGMALTSNLPDFKAAALRLIEDSKKPMDTDQDFADRIELCKKFEEAEKKIEMLQAQVVGEVHDVNAFCVDLGEISKLFRQARLAGTKLVDAEKTNRKNAILFCAQSKWKDHIQALEKRLNPVPGKPPYMPAIAADFATATKGLKSMSSMQNSVDTLLANLKISANETADKIDANLKTLRELATDYAFLFADTPAIVQKMPEDLVALVKSRIADHKAEQERKEEETRARIRKEEQERADREAAAKARAEQQERDRIAKEAADKVEAECKAEEAATTPVLAAAPVPPVLSDKGVADSMAREFVDSIKTADAPACITYKPVIPSGQSSSLFFKIQSLVRLFGDENFTEQEIDRQIHYAERQVIERSRAA